MTGASGISFFGNGKKDLDELSSFLSSPFSGWILTSLDLGTRVQESWYDDSSAHSDHQSLGWLFIIGLILTLKKNRTEE